MVPLVGQQCVFVVFPGHTHILFEVAISILHVFFKPFFILIRIFVYTFFVCPCCLKRPSLMIAFTK